MPTYEFKCKNCGKKVVLVMSFGDYEKKKYKCPKCNGKQLAGQRLRKREGGINLYTLR